MIKSSFRSESSRHCPSQSIRARELTFERMFTPHPGLLKVFFLQMQIMRLIILCRGICLNVIKKTCKNLKNFVKLCNFLSNYAIFFQMPVFLIFCSNVHILRRFLKILRRCASARLQTFRSSAPTHVSYVTWHESHVMCI